MSERDWDYFDELIANLAARASDAAGLASLQIRAKVLKMFQEAARTGFKFDVVNSLSDTDAASREHAAQKMSWILQHGLHSKCWCVNAKLFAVRNGRHYSPVVEQLKRIGISATTNRVQHFLEQSRQAHDVQTTVDSLLISADLRTIYIAKGCWYSSAMGSTRLIHANEAPLFATGGPFVTKARASSSACRSLVFAWGLLKDTFNHLEVKPLYCIIADPDAGWHFQAHDLGEPFLGQFPGKKVELDSFGVYRSSADFAERFRDDSDWVAKVPGWNAGSVLYSIPPDRSSRSLMILNVLHAEQAGNQREIVPVPSGRITSEVERIFDLFYTRDMQRHDLDHLTRRQLIQKHPGGGFSISALGIARFGIAAAAASENLSADFAEKLLGKVERQAELVWRDRGIR